MLTIQVESVDFDHQACVLRVKGRNIVENDYVKVSLYVIFISSLRYLLQSSLFIDECLPHTGSGTKSKIHLGQTSLG